MPVHDWSTVEPGLSHDFHQGWIVAIRNALNSRLLPDDHFALLDHRMHNNAPVGDLTEAGDYAARANRITVRHRHGQIVAVIEIVSPGSKSNRSEFTAFVDKSVELIRQGVHLLVVDLFPPTSRDPDGIHRVIWSEFDDSEVARPADKPLTLVSYEAEPFPVAYFEPVAVGDSLPPMPVFLKSGSHFDVPLEETYRSTWDLFPRHLRRLLEPG
jgi:Protein of unknown function (DUF4058)